MDAIELLRREALAQRKKAVRQAHQDYLMAIREIRTLDRKLRSTDAHRRSERFRRFHPIVGTVLHSMTCIQAAETVLKEQGSLTLVELTLEVMRRGCRSDDDPKAVAHAIRSSLRYHSERFSRDEEGRWGVLAA